MRIAIIGAGSIGQRHALNAEALGEIGVCDADGERAEAVAREVSGRMFTKLDQVFEWMPEAAVIAVPTAAHVETARCFVERSIPVLIEKPISHSLEGVEDLIAAGKSYGIPIVVACNMRFHPGPEQLHEAMPGIGQPLFLQAQFGNYLPNMRPGRDYRDLYCARAASGGGVILDSIHEVDYAAWLLGPVERVLCSAGKLSDLDIDVEDYAWLTMEHSGSARSEIHLDYLQQSKRRGCSVVGTEGTLVWTSEGKQPEQVLIRRFEKSTGEWTVLFQDDDFDVNRPYRRMMAAFVDRVLGRSDFAVDRLLDGGDALAALKACLAAHQSVASGIWFELA